MNGKEAKSQGFARSGVLVVVTVLGMLAGIVACTPADTDTNGEAAVPIRIECQAFYRSSVTESLGEGTTAILDTDGDLEAIRFEDMVVNARYQDEAFEGRSLFVTVVDRETGDQIAGHLYQMERDQKIGNPFLGGHGFTGLAYVYHPTSQAELQYFCQSR